LGDTITDITDATIAALRTAFPDRSISVGTSPAPIAVFVPAHPEVGSVQIWEDGNDLIVEIENVTHGHFACYDEVSEPEKQARTIARVVAFLRELFADRIVLWRAFGGTTGGWESFEPSSNPPRSSRFREVFLWSGPVPPN